MDKNIEELRKMTQLKQQYAEEYIYPDIIKREITLILAECVKAIDCYEDCCRINKPIKPVKEALEKMGMIFFDTSVCYNKVTITWMDKDYVSNRDFAYALMKNVCP